MAMPEIDGGLVGGASLDPDDFARIIRYAPVSCPRRTAGRPIPSPRGDPQVLVDAMLIVIHVIVSLILIVFILLHAGRGGGLSDMFGGAAGGSLAGSTVVEKNLDRLTVVVSLVFAFTTMLLSLRSTDARRPIRHVSSRPGKPPSSAIERRPRKSVWPDAFARALVAARPCCRWSLAACGSSSSKTAGSANSSDHVVTTGDRSRNGGTITIGAEQEPDCFDWIGAVRRLAVGHVDGADRRRSRMAFRTVVKDGELVEVPGAVLAGDAEVRDRRRSRRSPTTSTPAAVWSDGVPITCADFQYTADQQQNGKDIYDPTGYADIDTVTCPTPKTVVVTYKKGKTLRGLAGSCSRSGIGILPSHLLKGKDRDKALKNGYTWSGGPWFAKWNKGDSIVLTPNPKYWGPKPHLDKVVFKFETDTAAEFQAFKSGQVDAIYPQPQIDVVDAIKAGIPGRATRSTTSKTGTSRRCGSTTAKFPFDSKAVRQAIGYAIDRDAIVKKLFGPLGVTKAGQLAEPVRGRRLQRPERVGRSTSSNLDKVDQLMTGDGWDEGQPTASGRRAARRPRSRSSRRRRQQAA